MTGLLFESVRVKSGAFCPTCGAAADAGSHRPATKTTKRRPAKNNTPSAAAKELKIFETILLSGFEGTAQAEKQKHDRDREQDQIDPWKITRYRPPHEYKLVAKSRKQAEEKSCPDLPV